jgi:hypothetical protein
MFRFQRYHCDPSSDVLSRVRAAGEKLKPLKLADLAPTYVKGILWMNCPCGNPANNHHILASAMNRPTVRIQVVNVACDSQFAWHVFEGECPESLTIEPKIVSPCGLQFYIHNGEIIPTK